MLDWFRSWHGAPTDDKWLVVAKRAGVPAIIVPGIAWAFFDHASQADERGDVSGFDFETYAMKFGVEEDHVRAVYAAMEAKAIIVSGRIAQWEKRQPKREDNSTERMRKVRKPADAQDSLPLAADPLPAPAEQPEPQPTISATESPPEPPLISGQARTLADEIALAAGHDLEFVPPAWCGAASRVQVWLTNQWPPEIILRSVKAQMHRKRDGPPDRVQYFEKGIARAIAEQSAPLPNVVPFTAETTHARVSKPASTITAAVDRLIAELEVGSGAVRESAAGLLPHRRRQ